MKQVTIDRVQLLATIQKNLELHKKEYIESLEAYKVQLVKALKKQTDIAIAGGDPDLTALYRMQKPVSHESDYKQVIEMLSMSLDDEITLDYHEFQQYVMDQWAWKQTFAATSALYKG